MGPNPTGHTANLLPEPAEYRCGRCGYDRSGAPESPHCPECGAPATRDRWMVRGTPSRGPFFILIGTLSYPIVIVTGFVPAPPEIGLLLMGFMALLALILWKRPAQAVLSVGPEGLRLRWGFGEAALIPSADVRRVRFLIAPGIQWQRTGRTTQNKWTLEIALQPDASPASAAPPPRSPSSALMLNVAPRFVPPVLFLRGDRETIKQLERAIVRTLGIDHEAG